MLRITEAVRREVAASPVKEEGTRVLEVEGMLLVDKDKAEAIRTPSLMVVEDIRRANSAHKTHSSKVRHQDRADNMAVSLSKAATHMANQDLVPISSEAVVLCAMTDTRMMIPANCRFDIHIHHLAFRLEEHTLICMTTGFTTTSRFPLVLQCC